MIKIAISGKAKTGKNTLAEMLVNHIIRDKQEITENAAYKIVAVADPIKRMVLEMVPDASPNCLFGDSQFRSEVMPGNLKNDVGEPLTYRQALLDLGKLGRKYNPDIWLNALVKNVEKSEGIKLYITSDVRFFNEMEYLKTHGFYLVRMKRDDCPLIDDVSETAQSSIPDSYFDMIVENNGPLAHLDISAQNIAHKFV